MNISPNRKSFSHDTETRLVTVIAVLPNGGGFGETQDTGEASYISASKISMFNLCVGDVLASNLADNPRAEARHKTPYTVANIVSIMRAGEDVEACPVRRALLGGGVWTRDKLAADLGISDSAAAAAAERMYQRGECEKFVQFHSGKGAQRVWYTAHPELADVDEFED